MNILILGSGGREHAFAWKISKSNLCNNLFVAPGNAGTAACAINMPFHVTDFEKIKIFCIDEKIDLLIIGPEDPLVQGIVDYLKKEDELQQLLIIGPSKEAAQLEGSKAFAKSFMDRNNIPTAAYREFTEENFWEGIEYLKQHPLPIVLKADGLAAGKGVIICQNYVEALAEFELMIQRSKFGEAGKKVVVEEFLNGIELSVFVLTDGKDYLLLPEAKDYKRIGEGDKGANTGGMGAISPVPFADKTFMDKVVEKIIQPTVAGIAAENMDYTGFIFFGLIKVDNEPFVIEYNCRMGDPETEAVLPRIKSDLVEVLTATAKGNIKSIKLDIDERHATTIVAVSGGYPNHYEKGYLIYLPSNIENEEQIIFHSGTTDLNGNIVTHGGRVLCTTALGDTLDESIFNSKKLLKQIHFEDMYYRKDIGYEF